MDAYKKFVRCAARKLLAVPDNALSLLSGSPFRALRPELYEKVREGRAQFGQPAEQAYDDLVAARSARQRALPRRLHFWLVRGARHVLIFLRLMWFLRVVFPLSAGKMRGPATDILWANLPVPAAARGRGATPPLASIVVLSYDRVRYLKTSLAAFLATVGDVAHELIVVDNGSRDGSVEYLRDCRDRGLVTKLVLLAENQGTSGGYNCGFAAADPRSEYLMKLDSDIKLLSRGWLAASIDFLSANRDVGFAALNQINHPMLRLLPRQRRGRWTLMDFADWTSGGAMIIPERVRRELGCFYEDPVLRYAPDDIDYYVRASRKGYRTFYLRDLLVYHQTELDGTDYRDYNRAKPAVESSQLAIRLAGEYDRGERPLFVWYDKYCRPW